MGHKERQIKMERERSKGECHGNVLLSIAGWRSDQIKDDFGIHQKKQGVSLGEGIETRTQYSDFGNLYLVSLTLSGTKGASNTTFCTQAMVVFSEKTIY